MTVGNDVANRFLCRPIAGWLSGIPVYRQFSHAGVFTKETTVWRGFFPVTEQKKRRLRSDLNGLIGVCRPGDRFMVSVAE